MATTTLPPAADQDPFQLITVKNFYNEDLTVSPQPGEKYENIVDNTSNIRPFCAKTYQSDGIDSWYGLSTGKPDTNIYSRNASALPVTVPLAPTWTTLTGTEFTLNFEGVYFYTGSIEFDVTAVPGNQAWDVDLQLYDSTNAVVLGTIDMGGAGSPDAPVRNSWSLPLIGIQVGATNYLRVSRTTTSGDVIVDVCDTEITGPL